MPDEPLIFMKPDTALLRGRDFYIPDYSSNLHYEVELVLRISKEGKNIRPEFARRYFDKIGIGIDFTARDLQQKAIEKGCPWTLAKGFDHSAPVSQMKPVSRFANLNDINFSLTLNGQEKQRGNSGLMIYKFDYLIHYISRFVTLKTGDLIFTGTPKGVGPVKPGDQLKAFIEDEALLEIDIK